MNFIISSLCLSSFFETLQLLVIRQWNEKSIFNRKFISQHHFQFTAVIRPSGYRKIISKKEETNIGDRKIFVFTCDLVLYVGSRLLLVYWLCAYAREDFFNKIKVIVITVRRGFVKYESLPFRNTVKLLIFFSS